MTVLREIVTVRGAADLLRPLACDALAAWHNWQALSQSDAMPSWSKFSPAQHTKLLPYLALYHVGNADASKARIVLMGNEVARKLGIDSINVAIADVIAESNIDHLVNCLQYCVDTAQPAYT